MASDQAVSKDPTLEFEESCFAAGHELVIGIDEVGRGAIAGPVAVGVHAVSAPGSPFPLGLRDSKLLSEKKRELLAPLVAEWGHGAVGYVSAAEIDARGITWALGEAGRRALLSLHRAGMPVARAVILVDGKHDWLSPALRAPLNVHTMVGGDRACECRRRLRASQSRSRSGDAQGARSRTALCLGVKQRVRGESALRRHRDARAQRAPPQELDQVARAKSPRR